MHVMSLCRCPFMRPAEEGSLFSRHQEKKGVTASTTEPGQPRPRLVSCVICNWGASPSLSILGRQGLSGRGEVARLLPPQALQELERTPSAHPGSSFLLDCGYKVSTQ